jgi:bifunctional ADP-heptose synthase (sugar kinase/adenylyltransferase)
MAEAAYLANAAAALVVRRLGCASNTPNELMSILEEAGEAEPSPLP